MCGRFNLTWDAWRRVAEALGINDESDIAVSYRPRFNIAPTDQHFIVTSKFERRNAQQAPLGLGQPKCERQQPRRSVHQR